MKNKLNLLKNLKLLVGKNRTIAVIGLTFFLTLSGCQNSGTNNSNQNQQAPEVDLPNENTPAIIIDDIQCNSSYPLTIKTITKENESNVISELFDRDKTNTSVWQASNIDSTLVIELDQPARLKQLIITWQNMEDSHLFQLSASKNKSDWQLLNTTTQSKSLSLIPEVITLANSDEITARYIKLELNGSALNQASNIIEFEAFGCTNNVEHNIELIDWYLSVPTDTDNNGKSDSINETDLANGYYDPRFFSLSQDGGLVFTTSVSGYRTSTNTKYVRSELREMLRRGDTRHKTQGVNQNNWVFSSAPQTDLDNTGGIDGELNVELAVNKVTTTGEAYQIGRVIIGQIHANDDEPVRLYYRKLPNNHNGAIYLAHEKLGGNDSYYELIGTRDNSANNPTNGIPLNEKFHYQIKVVGNELTVEITKADGSRYQQIVDMSASNYDVGGQYMYFKAGVYNQNNSGDKHDYVQATFYQITNSHQGY